MKKKILIFILSGLMLIVIVLINISSLPVNAVFGNYPREADNFFGNKVRFSDAHTPVVRDSDNNIVGCFVSDGIAGVRFRQIVDGDTAHFYCKINTNLFFNVRFLLVDAPEIFGPAPEPYGHEATNFARDRLQNAEAIILDGVDAANFSQGRTDIFGRWLALIWYVPQGGNPQKLDEFRLLQLDLIEHSLAEFVQGSMSRTDRRFVFQVNPSENIQLYKHFADQFGSLCITDVVYIAYKRIRTLGLKIHS